MSHIRDLVATAVDLTKCWLCGEPAVTTERTLLGVKVGLCDLHAGKKR